MGWFGYRRQEADQKLRLLHLDLLCRAVSHSAHMGGAAWTTQGHWFKTCNIYYLQDVLFWLKGKQEIEIVDFLLRVKRCLVSGHNILASGRSVLVVKCHKSGN